MHAIGIRIIHVGVAALLVSAASLPWTQSEILEGLQRASGEIRTGICEYTIVSTDYKNDLSPAEFEAQVDRLVENYKTQAAVHHEGRTLTETQLSDYRAQMVEFTRRSSDVTVHHVRETRFVFDENKTRVAFRQSPDYLKAYGNDVWLEESETFDGQVAMKLVHHSGTNEFTTTGVITSTRTPMNVGETKHRHPRDFGRIGDMGRIADGRFELIAEETLDDTKCAVMQSADGTQRLWVSPEKGYLIVREEEYRLEGGNSPHAIIEFSGIEKFGQFYFPTRAQIRYFSKKGLPSYDLEFQFAKVQLNVSVAAEEFRIQFPQGTNVSDQRTGDFYIVGGADQEVMKGFQAPVGEKEQTAAVSVVDAPAPNAVTSDERMKQSDSAASAISSRAKWLIALAAMAALAFFAGAYYLFRRARKGPA